MATRRNGRQKVDEQHLESHHRHDRAVRLPGDRRNRQRLRERNARQQKARMHDDQRQRRPARDQLAIAGMPKLAGAQAAHRSR
jgi:hypothetical protein